VSVWDKAIGYYEQAPAVFEYRCQVPPDSVRQLLYLPTRLLESGAELVDIQALLGHVNPSTMQIYTHVGEDRMASMVSKL